MEQGRVCSKSTLGRTRVTSWTKTRGLAYVSDFQGGTSLLSDPQIMTHPALSAIFSQGNVGEVFMVFPTQHICATNSVLPLA